MPTSEPEYLPPDWTSFLGGPVPYPVDQDDQESTKENALPSLEPVPDSPTMARLRIAAAIANARSRWGL
ncbi:hypothetical protein ACIOJE_08060 [Kitasatospora sp. NPDC087861]|uniref:hypothetical protein n=1 Tax=Kitasatospora sp. NPDC087861 TaxID=3364070 RepID=UPI0037F71138